MGMTEVANWDFGRLEIFFEGSWGQVCGSQFSDADATVACRQLGYTATGAAFLLPTLKPCYHRFQCSKLEARIEYRIANSGGPSAADAEALRPGRLCICPALRHWSICGR